jgi:hypothetical protein
MLNETIYDFDWLKHPKIKQINIGHRITYLDAFRYARRYLDRNTIKILCNNDMSYNIEDLACLRYYSLNNRVICLSRFDIDCNVLNYNDTHLFLESPFSRTQDTWIFTDYEPLPNTNFCLGTTSCDNRIAKITADMYIAVNCAFSIRTYHHHNSCYRPHSSHFDPRVKNDWNKELIRLELVVDDEIEYIRNKLFPKQSNLLSQSQSSNENIPNDDENNSNFLEPIPVSLSNPLPNYKPC